MTSNKIDDSAMCDAAATGAPVAVVVAFVVVTVGFGVASGVGG